MKKYFSSGFFLVTWSILLLPRNVFRTFTVLQGDAMQRTPFVLYRKHKIHAYSFKYRYLSIKHIIFATLSLNSFWCCFRASKRLFLGVKRRNCLQFVEFSFIFEHPSYSTPLLDHFPGSLCTPEQVSRCRSAYRRLTKNTVFVQI